MCLVSDTENAHCCLRPLKEKELPGPSARRQRGGSLSVWVIERLKLPHVGICLWAKPVWYVTEAGVVSPCPPSFKELMLGNIYCLNLT